MLPGRCPLAAETVDATLLAARDTQVNREFRLIDLPRLSEMAVDERATAQLSVRFHLVSERVGIVGHASTTLQLTCQRCLSPVQVPVEDEFHVVLIGSENEVDQLPEQQDAIVVDPTRLELQWLLEEQLLLAMPLVPMHATHAECSQNKLGAGKVDVVEPAANAAEETQRPFADLRGLLSQSRKGRPDS